MITIVQTKQEIIETLRKNQSEIRALGVKRLGLFGSFVRSEQRTDSDVDMLVEFENGQKTFDHFMQLSFLLEDMLGRSVELVTPESLSPYVGPYILNCTLGDHAARAIRSWKSVHNLRWSGL